MYYLRCDIVSNITKIHFQVKNNQNLIKCHWKTFPYDKHRE